MYVVFLGTNLFLIIGFRLILIRKFSVICQKSNYERGRISSSVEVIEIMFLKRLIKLSKLTP